MRFQTTLLAVLASAGVLTVPAAHAADWEYVSATGASNVYADLASVQARGETRTVWYLFDHLDTRYDIDSARVFKSSMHLIEVDCASQNLEWRRMEKFAGPRGTGSKVSARAADTLTASIMESVPDQARIAMAEAVCTE